VTTTASNRTMARTGSKQADARIASLLRIRFRLTSAEARVGLLVMDGFSYAEIAERLSVSPSTVHTYIKEIHRKLDVLSRARAAAMIHELEYQQWGCLAVDAAAWSEDKNERIRL
jgi:DNA-binding CsgD family transcriptional regulator